MNYHYFKRYLQFIVSKRKTVISSPARSCFFLSQYFTYNTKYTLQITILL